MKQIKSEASMKEFGERIGRLLRGGETFELIGDVGAGKTTLTKGIGVGLQVDDDIQSPSFTLSREYRARDGLELHHYDFYRLIDPGVVAYELSESIADPRAVTIVEWAETVHEVLPEERVAIRLQYSEAAESREYSIDIPSRFSYLEESTK